MTQQEIEFIRARWMGRANGSDIQKLLDEIVRLEGIIDIQTYAIEDKIMDTIKAETELDFLDDGAD